MKEIVENKEAKYSVMLYELVQRFDDKLPEELTFEDTLEVGIEAWNLANNKGFLDPKVYEKELKKHKYAGIIEEMVAYKLDKYAEYDNIIVDYSTVGDMLRVKTQTFENYFLNLIL